MAGPASSERAGGEAGSPGRHRTSSRRFHFWAAEVCGLHGRADAMTGRDKGCGSGRVWFVSSKVESFSRSTARAYPVLSGAVLSLTPTPRNRWPRPPLCPRPAGPRHRHSDRLPQVDSCTHARGPLRFSEAPRRVPPAHSWYQRLHIPPESVQIRTRVGNVHLWPTRAYGLL